jgi:hypothetical protein
MRSASLAASVFLTTSMMAEVAMAKVPQFAAACPTDIRVETDRSGRAYIGGKKAKVRSTNPNYSEISAAGVTISVARTGDGLIVSYTAKGGANGVCQVVEQGKVENPTPTKAPAAARDDVPARDKSACLRAVRKTTNNPKVVVIEAISSEANNTVTVGVGPDRAPWRCLVKRGVVADVMSQTNEGRL